MATPLFTFAKARRCALGIGVVLLVRGIALAGPSAGVAVLQPAAWSPDDAARRGAGELEVLLHLARLRQDYVVAGLVSIGDHNGMRLAGGELALRHAALSGVPVAKLARDGSVAADPDALFLDGGRRDANQVARVLVHCLEQFGPSPVAANPDRPTARELDAIRAHLRKFQEALVADDRPRLAAR